MDGAGFIPATRNSLTPAFPFFIMAYLARCVRCQQSLYEALDVKIGSCRRCRENFLCFACGKPIPKENPAARKRAVCDACLAKHVCYNCGGELYDHDEQEWGICQNCRH